MNQDRLHKILDTVHVSEYLAEAAKVIAGPEQGEWLLTQQRRLKANQVNDVLRELRKHQMRPLVPAPATTEKGDPDPVQACKQYLENRPHYLDYAGALAADLPIGSGEVESGHRSVVQARLKLPGAWWKEETADNMLALRTRRANGDWESYWREARQAAA